MYADFINAALAQANATDIEDLSPGNFVAWRTAGSGSPGDGFIEYATVQGKTFYYVRYWLAGAAVKLSPAAKSGAGSGFLSEPSSSALRP